MERSESDIERLAREHGLDDDDYCHRVCMAIRMSLDDLWCWDIWGASPDSDEAKAYKLLDKEFCDGENYRLWREHNEKER